MEDILFAETTGVYDVDGSARIGARRSPSLIEPWESQTPCGDATGSGHAHIVDPYRNPSGEFCESVVVHRIDLRVRDSRLLPMEDLDNVRVEEEVLDAMQEATQSDIQLMSSLVAHSAKE
jgi:hypothetical protein